MRKKGRKGGRKEGRKEGRWCVEKTSWYEEGRKERRKERKGKERKGKERKGKERKGKEGRRKEGRKGDLENVEGLVQVIYPLGGWGEEGRNMRTHNT
jgi:hypothetical protein